MRRFMESLLPALAGLSLLALGISSAWSDTIVLEPGETYRAGDHDITCVPHRHPRPVALGECQYWDDFDKRCLYERKVVSVGALDCVEECQHWDDFRKGCDYATTCTFYPDQGLFVQTSCDEFDTFSRHCLRVKEVKIPGK